MTSGWICISVVPGTSWNAVPPVPHITCIRREKASKEETKPYCPTNPLGTETALVSKYVLQRSAIIEYKVSKVTPASFR